MGAGAQGSEHACLSTDATAELLVKRSKQGIEQAQGLLALALEELEIARQQEEAELQQRAAGLQRQYQERVAELERRFLVQAEELQRELARSLEAQAQKSQQALDALASQLLEAVETAPAASVPSLIRAAASQSPRTSPVGGKPGSLQWPRAAKDQAGLKAVPGVAAMPPRLLHLLRQALPASPVALPASPAALPASPASSGRAAPQRAPAQAPADAAGAQRAQRPSAPLRHESSSEYSDCSYCFDCEEDSQDDIAARPPPLKTLTPAGMAPVLQRKASMTSLTLPKPGGASAAPSPQALGSKKASPTPTSPLMRQYSPCFCMGGKDTLSGRFGDVLSDDDD